MINEAKTTRHCSTNERAFVYGPRQNRRSLSMPRSAHSFVDRRDVLSCDASAESLNVFKKNKEKLCKYLRNSHGMEYYAYIIKISRGISATMMYDVLATLHRHGGKRKTGNTYFIAILY